MTIGIGDVSVTLVLKLSATGISKDDAEAELARMVKAWLAEYEAKQEAEAK
jgi:hypothetical protein